MNASGQVPRVKSCGAGSQRLLRSPLPGRCTLSAMAQPPLVPPLELLPPAAKASTDVPYPAPAPRKTRTAAVGDTAIVPPPADAAHVLPPDAVPPPATAPPAEPTRARDALTPSNTHDAPPPPSVGLHAKSPKETKPFLPPRPAAYAGTANQHREIRSLSKAAETLRKAREEPLLQLQQQADHHMLERRARVREKLYVSAWKLLVLAVFYFYAYLPSAEEARRKTVYVIWAILAGLFVDLLDVCFDEQLRRLQRRLGL